MVKIKYTGSYQCNITIYDLRQENWNKGEVREIPKYYADKLLLDSKEFSLAEETVEKEVKVVAKEKFDLDGDNDFDKDDLAIAAKVLAKGKKKNG
jgi:hypothetical protein